MKKVWLIVTAIMVAGGLGLSGGWAHEEHPTHLPSAKDDPLGFRTYLMENIGDNAKELNDKIKANNIKAAKLNAQAIALHATRIPELFPPGSTSEQSRAKDEIWQKWDEFVQSAQTLQNEADQLGVTTAEGNADVAQTQVKQVFSACKSCHDTFRKPEEKK